MAKRKASSSESGSSDSEEGDDENIISKVKIPEKPVIKKGGSKGQIADFTMEFLKNLDENNSKDWMDLNRNIYQGIATLMLHLNLYQTLSLNSIQVLMMAVREQREFH